MTRIALLDSIGVMPCLPIGRPFIFGARPVKSFVDWVVPPSSNGVRAFIRVRVRANGAGNHDFTRVETIQRTAETRAEWASAWASYLDYITPIYGKPVADPGSSATPTASLRVHSAGSPEVVTLEFATNPEGGPTSVAIHDAAGRLLSTPYSSSSSDGASQRVEYRFESSGVYLVSLMHNGRPVATSTITVAR